MSEMSRSARRAARAKAHRLVQASKERVDASDYGPEEVLGADVKTGMRPVSRRAFKKGGKIVAVEGADAKQHAGRMPRKSGGKALVNDFTNRDVKDANAERDGEKHVGGLKSGGRAKRADGGNAGDMVPTGLLPSQGAQSRMTKAAGLKTGGRAKRADGGPAYPVRIDLDQAKRATTARDQAAADRYKRVLGSDADIVRRGNAEPREKTPTSGPSTSNYKRGGGAFEGSAKDVREDKKLAKKHHQTMAEWERSEGDKKHDKQRSAKGLKSGGEADGKWIQGAIKHPGALRKSLHVAEGETIPAKKLKKAEHSGNPKLAKRAHLAETLKRMHRKDGGRAKGKTNINIIIGRGGQPAQPAPGLMPPGSPGGQPVPVPVGPPPLGATGPQISGSQPMPTPAAPPPIGGGAPMGPSPLLRKRGGRTYASYKDMDAGAGSGDGRLEKTEIAKRKR